MSQNNEYSNVPVYTGCPPAEQGAGFFQPPAPAAEGILATDQARAVAEVQAALVIAASRPRNELRARDRLLQACQRVNLASGALYQYSRGGTAVSGPSIRLAEAAARSWGNMTYGFRELSRRTGESECEAFAWDLETNTKAVRQFSVRHRRDTKKGGYDLTDERDIYELMANQAQRRVRAAILEIIPGDIMEDAVAECEKTMHANVGNVAEAAAKLIQAFADMGIPRESVEKRLGHRIDAIQPAQIIAFRKIYASIKDGMSEPKDWFDLPANDTPEPATQAAQAEAPAPEQEENAKPAKSAGKKRTSPAAKSPAPAASTGPNSPAQTSAPDSAAKTAAAPQGSAAFSAQNASDSPSPTGRGGGRHGAEVFGPAAGLITCPNTGQQVDELDCTAKSCREGCPVFEF